MYASYWLGSVTHGVVYTAAFAALALIGAFCYTEREIPNK
jgi:hypothetical protein